MCAPCCQCEIERLKRELFVAKSERDRLAATNAELVTELEELKRHQPKHCRCHRCQ